MYFNVQAIVLGSHLAGEEGRRLSLFTREKGRLLAWSHGAGRSGGKLAAASQAGVAARLRLWMEPSKPFGRVAGGVVENSFPAVRAHWRRRLTALFLCEWTDRLTALQEAHPEKYDLLHRALSYLEHGNLLAGRMAFLIQFLRQAGYRVGEEALGSRHRRWRGLVEALEGYDFSGTFADASLAAEAPALQERLVKFVEPLLARPFKTLVHEKALEKYMKSSSDTVESLIPELNSRLSTLNSQLSTLNVP